MKGIKFLLLVLIFSCAHQNEEDPIVRTIYSRNRQFQQCHMESDSFKEEGKLKMRATLNKSGEVKEAQIVESTFTDANLQSLKFPEGQADEIIVPFTFQSGEI
jgi:hypothetical protein